MEKATLSYYAHCLLKNLFYILVDHLYGEAVARGVGRGLIIPWPPNMAQMPARVVE